MTKSTGKRRHTTATRNGRAVIKKGVKASARNKSVRKVVKTARTASRRNRKTASVRTHKLMGRVADGAVAAANTVTQAVASAAGAVVGTVQAVIPQRSRKRR